jgi:hypothetical protein
LEERDARIIDYLRWKIIDGEGELREREEAKKELSREERGPIFNSQHL